jgi:ribosomal protein L37AE/L43A
MKRMKIRVWACPEDDCRNYYGSSSQEILDLGAEQNLESDMRHGTDHDPAHPKVVGNRGQCPDCRTRGKTVQRVAVDVIVPVRAEAAVVTAG